MRLEKVQLLSFGKHKVVCRSRKKGRCVFYGTVIWHNKEQKLHFCRVVAGVSNTMEMYELHFKTVIIFSFAKALAML